MKQRKRNQRNFLDNKQKAAMLKGASDSKDFVKGLVNLAHLLDSMLKKGL